MQSSDVTVGSVISASVYNLLRADVIAAASAVAVIQAAASFHADYVQFEDEVRFEGDVNFRVYKSGDDTHFQFDDQVYFGWDDNMARINTVIGASVVGYFDDTGWHDL